MTIATDVIRRALDALASGGLSVMSAEERGLLLDAIQEVTRDLRQPERAALFGVMVLQFLSSQVTAELLALSAVESASRAPGLH